MADLGYHKLEESSSNHQAIIRGRCDAIELQETHQLLAQTPDNHEAIGTDLICYVVTSVNAFPCRVNLAGPVGCVVFSFSRFTAPCCSRLWINRAWNPGRPARLPETNRSTGVM